MTGVSQTTSPLVKFIRTGEGVLVYAFNSALLIVPIISSALTPAQALAYAGVFNLVVVISRTGLKIVAQLKPVQPAAESMLAGMQSEITGIVNVVMELKKTVERLAGSNVETAPSGGSPSSVVAVS